jgi:DNA repair exonuclease SbcCD ATPase subunit
MKIKELILENFFGYRGKHIIPFDPNLTIIKGENDNGKSTILHAIRWITHNDPKGSDLIWRNDETEEIEKKATVTVIMEDGKWVKKSRTKTKTSYETSETEGIFETSEIPIEVTEIIGIKKHKLGSFETDLNYVFQHDSPFLISESAGDGAAVLGYLANTESIDMTATRLEKTSKGLKREIKAQQNEIKKLEIRVSEYDLVDEYLEEVELFSEKLETIEKNKILNSKLVALKEKKIKNEIEKESLNIMTDKLGALDSLASKSYQLKKNGKISETLNTISNKYLSNSDSINILDKIEFNLKTIPNLIIEKEATSKIIEKNSKLNSLYSSYNKNENILEKLIRNDKILKLEGSKDSSFKIEKENFRYKELEIIDKKNKIVTRELKVLHYTDDRLKVIPGIKEVPQKLVRLKELWTLFNSYNKNDYSILTSLEKKLKDIPEKTIELDQIKKLERLINLKKEYDKLEVMKMQELTNKLENIPKIVNIDDKMSNIGRLQWVMDELKDINLSIVNLEDRIKNNDLEVNEKETELKELWESVGDVCPVCHSVIKTKEEI